MYLPGTLRVLHATDPDRLQDSLGNLLQSPVKLVDRDLLLQRVVQFQRLSQTEQLLVAPVAGQVLGELFLGPAAALPAQGR